VLTKTYLDQCLKDGILMRWPDKAFPIAVYIAPFRWYEKSKQMQGNLYNKLVLEALDDWSRLSGGVVSFKVVQTLNESQIDIKWRRVDRKSLGHCEYNFTKEGMIYSAEVQIGISDGIIHARYNDISEVKHTIIHEIGHAVGLIGHSTGPNDIMYVPHQYGIDKISSRDAETLKWLYKFPVGFEPAKAGKEFNLKEPYNIHTIIAHLSGEASQESYQKAETPERLQSNQAKLIEHHDILTQQGKF
jgi:predicted Zn-dependent protease